MSDVQRMASWRFLTSLLLLCGLLAGGIVLIDLPLGQHGNRGFDSAAWKAAEARERRGLARILGGRLLGKDRMSVRELLGDPAATMGEGPEFDEWVREKAGGPKATRKHTWIYFLDIRERPSWVSLHVDFVNEGVQRVWVRMSDDEGEE